jgi:hypothetical protein
MLDPDPIIDTIVGLLQAIPALTEGTPTPVIPAANIVGHHDYYGAELSLSKTLYEMTTPGIVIFFDGLLGGNFDGMTLWKLRFGAALRLANQAGQASPIGYGGLWQLMMNAGPVKAFDEIIPHDGSNMRNVQIYDNLLLMDTPSLARRIDETQMDYFIGSMVFPEIGDIGM